MTVILLLAACLGVFVYVRRDRIGSLSARRRTLQRLVGTTDTQRAKRRWTLPRPAPSKTSAVAEALACADFLDNVERNVRLGRSLRSAVLESHAQLPHGTLRDALEATVLYCRTGAPLEELLTSGHGHHDSADILFVVRSLVAAAAGGTGTAHALERASWVLRERHVVREERRVHAAQAVLSARVMSWMPIGFGTVMILVSPSVRDVVLFSPLGVICVVIGLSLNLLGRRWMGRITGAVA